MKKIHVLVTNAQGDLEEVGVGVEKEGGVETETVGAETVGAEADVAEAEEYQMLQVMSAAIHKCILNATLIFSILASVTVSSSQGVS